MTVDPQIILAVQHKLALPEDGIAGPQTWMAIYKALVGTDWLHDKVHTGIASSFADPADVRRYKACKARGGTDNDCFKVGDNGIGAWGHDTTREDQPMCAIPRDVWKAAGKTGGAKVVVFWEGKTVEGVLGDTLPFSWNVTNGAVIDLNPGFAKALNVRQPFMLHGVRWEWA